MASKAQVIDFLLAGYRDSATDVPLAGGSVEVYTAGTVNADYVWDDRDKTLPTTTGRSTVTLDAYGRAEVYGDAIYKFIIKDSGGVTIETIDYFEAKSVTAATLNDQVASYAALKALDITVLSNGASIMVGYKSSVTDDAGDVFVLDTADHSAEVTNDPDELKWVAPNSDATGLSGAWKRQGADGIVDLRWTGIDKTGATDGSAYIQSWITYAATNGVEAIAGDGTYLLNGSRQGTYNAIILLKSGLTIKGSGYGCHFKVADAYTAGGDYRVFGPEDTSDFNNVEITGIRIDGNGLNNLVLGSTGADIRRAYQINMLAGNNIYIHGNWFENCPGRNVVSLGQNSDPPDFTNVRIIDNKFTDVGGAIVGNDLQNDHSSIYLQTDGGIVSGNVMVNTTQPNPFTTPAKTINALEIHGKNTIVSENIVRNFTGGGNLVASVHDSENNTWINNRFYGVTSNVLTLWSAASYTNKRLTIRGNIIELDNTTYNAGTAIYQNPATGVTSTELEDLVIEDNVIYATYPTGKATTWFGIGLVAVNGCSIRRNVIKYTQGSGISLAEATSDLNIKNVVIESNEIADCGIHTAVSSIWCIYIKNSLTTREFANIDIRNNRFIRTPQAVAAAPLNTRGITVVGGGYIRDITFDGNNFNFIPRAYHYTFTTTTYNKDVVVLPLRHISATASDPVRGFFTNGYDYVIHSDPAASGTFGKVPTTSGSASSATWGAATGYTMGTWIKTSGNKTIICMTDGTSDALTEPNPTTLGEQVTDGTVTWLYVDTAVAAFKTFGAISA